MSIAGEIEILKDLEAVSARAAELIGDRIRGCTAPFRLALSGGTTPRGCYRHLAHLHQVPWDCVEIYLGDERFVPHDHPESNYRMIRELLLAHRTVNPRGVFAVPGDGDAHNAARTYEEILRQQYGSSHLLADLPLFDLQLLGLGAGRPYRIAVTRPAGTGREDALGLRRARRPPRAANYPDLSGPGIQPPDGLPGQLGRPRRTRWRAPVPATRPYRQAA